MAKYDTRNGAITLMPQQVQRRKWIFQAAKKRKNQGEHKNVKNKKSV